MLARCNLTRRNHFSDLRALDKVAAEATHARERATRERSSSSAPPAKPAKTPRALARVELAHTSCADLAAGALARAARAHALAALVALDIAFNDIHLLGTQISSHHVPLLGYSL